MPTDTSMALEDGVEQAIIAWIANSSIHGVTLGIVARQEFMDSTTELTLPAVIVKVEVQEELAPGTGVFKLGCSVTLRTQSDDTLAASQRQQWGNLRSILMWSDLPGAFNTWLTAQGQSLFVHENSVVHDESMPRTESERHWEQVWRFTCWGMSQAGP